MEVRRAIDFIGHHSIHMQGLEPIMSALYDKFECRALMGPAVRPSGARIAVVTDHLAFQPHVNSSNYDVMFHVSHDLSDVHVYRDEVVALEEFTAILVPSEIHFAEARKALPKVECKVIGWTKFDRIIPPKELALNTSLKPTVLFAWTDIYNTDWRKILKAASISSLNFILKNHVYYEKDLGFAPPLNQDREYARYSKESEEMDRFLTKLGAQNIEVVDAKNNLAHLFPRAQILITDWSSAALEFTEFGISLETGRVKRRFMRRTVSRESSALAKEVRFLPEMELINELPTMTVNDFKDLPFNPNAQYEAKSFFPDLQTRPSQLAADSIELFSTNWQKNKI